MILNGLSGSLVTDTANGKSGVWQSSRAPGVNTGNTQRIGSAPEPDRASIRQDSASIAGANASDQEDSGPVRFGAAGLPVFFETDANPAASNEVETASIADSGSDDTSPTQRADRMKYLVDAMRNARQPLESTDGFRQTIAAYRENFE